ncbi:D-Ala-D-Ala carboxypeptidase [Actibacterium mucosum KCTC 23349]|uniref:serine-type D-Ala-D-Ala carboxypeptidase n=2 Tax=Actibacterium TaxID=1433986 RepID=A0A037ZHM7_9RHOB|nr:D-Ala-D-Ala carboxypeptidase [Actibacterium mucosum KCTC 23349]
MLKMRANLIGLCLAALVASPVMGFETRATSAFVLDQTTGTVLLNKNAQVPLPPASMSKLMTLNMLFEALRDGRVTLDTQFSVSTRAKSMGGSTMFLNERDRPTVEELIRGIVVQSGNDACVVVAEGLAGTEDAFARLMNTRAKALGMNNSTFANASGWPNPNQRMSMEDLAVLANRLITEFPEYYGYFGETEFGYDGRAPDNRFNRNPLLKLGIGADGLKTGHTNEAGYGLVGSARQGTRRVIVVFSGLQSAADRAREAESLINWAFRQFVEKSVAKAGTRMAEAQVWMGAAPRVGLVVADDVTLLVPALTQGSVQAEVQFEGPIQAPVTKGDVLGKMIVQLPDMEAVEIPLVAESDVAKGGFLPRVKTAAMILLDRLGARAQTL